MSSVIAVTNRRICTNPFLDQVEWVCSRGPKALMLREKDLAPGEYSKLAGEVLTICKSYGVPFIAHSFVDAVPELKPQALHLSLPALTRLRESGEPRLPHIIGCSVHSTEEAVLAQRLGAAYLVAGHVFATGCKPGAPPRGLGFLREVCEGASIPVYGIGGIPPEKEAVLSIRQCGAAGACIMSGLMEGL